MRTRSPFDDLLRGSRLAGRTERVPAADPLAWLATRPRPHIYWHDRAEGAVWAGSGAAFDTAAGPGAAIVPGVPAGAALRDSLRLARKAFAGAGGGSPVPRLFGGGPFDPRDAAFGRWSDFIGARFVLPQVTLRCDAAGCFATAWGRSEGEILDLIEEARTSAEAARGHRRRSSGWIAADPGEGARWRQRVEDALAAIAGGEVQKDVLSRAIQCASSEPFDVAAILGALERRDERSTPFLFEFGRGGAFLGASPELLLRARGDVVQSECIAGTAARGATAEEDSASAAAVLGSEKDRREHDHVVEAVLEAFRAFCTDVAVDRMPALLTLSSVHHLRVGMRGRLKTQGRVDDLLTTLHPTPAVGGTPRAPALDLIRRLEGSSRGWYAGPVGWIEPDAAEFVVAIRSALVSGTRAWAFAGSGIVAGSNERSEWAETEMKARPMIEALTGSGT